MDPISGVKIENGKDKKDAFAGGRHNGVYIKIGKIDKNSGPGGNWLEISSFLEYSISAFYTTHLLCPF